MPCFRVIAKFLTCKVHKFTGKSYCGKQSLPPSLFCIKIALVLWRICMGFQNKTFRHRKKVYLLKGWFYFLWSLLGVSSRTVWSSARGNASKAKGEFSCSGNRSAVLSLASLFLPPLFLPPLFPSQSSQSAGVLADLILRIKSASGNYIPLESIR